MLTRAQRAARTAAQVLRELREHALPSAMPDPPELRQAREARPRRTVQQHHQARRGGVVCSRQLRPAQVWRTAWGEYRASWAAEPAEEGREEPADDANASQQEGAALQAEAGALSLRVPKQPGADAL